MKHILISIVLGFSTTLVIQYLNPGLNVTDKRWWIASVWILTMCVAYGVFRPVLL